MCTSITYTTKDHYFGSNFDYELSYGEQVVVTPRNYVFEFCKEAPLSNHYAIIGVATVVNDYPLYYDATNEKGLSIAGLNFAGLADYKPYVEGKENITPFELIPWLLGRCANVSQARELLDRMNLVKINFSPELPLADLHWMLSDQNESIVIECVKEGLKIYDNPIGVLTNNPEFKQQVFQLNNYRSLSTKTPADTFAKGLNLDVYSRGMGGLGLPGDLSSSSRFIKATFTKWNSVSGESEAESVVQFFHILGAVEQQMGLCDVGDEKYEHTIYSSCCNMDKGIFYYRSYHNSQITGVDMHKEDLDGQKLACYPLINEQQFNIVNA
ncbi:choloylglycine hydrolase [Enterococcus cecorum]